MLLVFAIWAAAPAVAGAQAKTSGGFDSFLLLVSPRDTVTIKKSLRAATEAGTLAENRRQQAETMRLGARARIEAKKVEIVRIKERASMAPAQIKTTALSRQPLVSSFALDGITQTECEAKFHSKRH